MVDSLEQLPTHDNMANLPTDKDIHIAIQQLNDSAAGNSGIRTKLFKALATDEDTFNIIRQYTHKFWKEEVQPKECDTGKLGILPKKGTSHCLAITEE